MLDSPSFQFNPLFFTFMATTKKRSKPVLTEKILEEINNKINKRYTNDRSGKFKDQICWSVCLEYAQKLGRPVGLVQKSLNRYTKKKKKKVDDTTWEDRMSSITGMPFDLLLADAIAHERSFSANSGDD